MNNTLTVHSGIAHTPGDTPHKESLLHAAVTNHLKHTHTNITTNFYTPRKISKIVSQTPEVAVTHVTTHLPRMLLFHPIIIAAFRPEWSRDAICAAEGGRGAR